MLWDILGDLHDLSDSIQSGLNKDEILYYIEDIKEQMEGELNRMATEGKYDEFR